jgi:hypothetical protein
MDHADYLRARAIRLRELASRASHPEHECYLLWRAAADDYQADQLEAQGNQQ